MGKHAILVMGPAGSGKTTFCKTLSDHYADLRRSVHVANFDPAAEDPLPYHPSIDLRELISLEDAMEAKGLGPNGGLVFCMEYLMDHSLKWLRESIDDFSEDFLIIDLPGQIELLAHIPVIPALVDMLQNDAGYHVATVFVLDSVAVTVDGGKFISGCMITLSAMLGCDCPCLPLLSKCDLLSPEVKREGVLDRYLDCELDYLDLSTLPAKHRSLNRALSRVISDFSLVRYTALNITDSDSVAYVGRLLDETLMVAEDAEVRDTDFEGGEGEGGGGEGMGVGPE